MDHSYAAEKLTSILRDLNQYTADEFRRQMARIISGTTGQEVPDDCHTIKADRDELAAQNEALREAYKELSGAINDLDDCESDTEEFEQASANVFAVMQCGYNNALRATPLQCLRDVQVEAVKTFVESVINDHSTTELCAHYGSRGVDSSDLTSKTVVDVGDIMESLDQYAAKVRQGGE